MVCRFSYFGVFVFWMCRLLLVAVVRACNLCVIFLLSVIVFGCRMHLILHSPSIHPCLSSFVTLVFHDSTILSQIYSSTATFQIRPQSFFFCHSFPFSIHLINVRCCCCLCRTSFSSHLELCLHNPIVC